MAVYHIEFRIRGHAKQYAKTLIYEVGRKFTVRGMTRKHVVPHISLYGPFLTRRQRNVVAEVVKVCSKYECVPFTFKGFNYFDNSVNKVIYLDIVPSDELVNLRSELAGALIPITYSKSKEDRKDKTNFKFHSTIAFKDIDNKFGGIWSYISSKERPNFGQHLLRVTIIKNSKILYEYDLIQHRLLNRRQALDRAIFASTIRKLKGEQGDKPNKEKEDTGKKESILDKIRSMFRW